MTECGFYVHIPFCEKRCRYCSFFSSISGRDVVSAYVDELASEISKAGAKYKDVVLRTIYFGGGTPSLLFPDQLERIFNALHGSFAVENPEITIEVNPNSANYLKEYKSMGINRISLGVQSVHADLLKKLGRIHTPEQAFIALEKAADIFGNVSADIILGTDERQNPKRELDAVAPFVKHISAYMLTLEEGTELYKGVKSGKITVPDEDSSAAQYETFVSAADEKGFYRYETSNFAVKGFESRHNSSYWNLTPYIGIGAGAHSFFGGKRFYNPTDINAYINGAHSGNGKVIIERDADPNEDKYEYVMLSLRTVKGVDLSEYANKFGSDFLSDFSVGIKKSEEYLRIDERQVSILPKYFLVQNAVIRSVLN